MTITYLLTPTTTWDTIIVVQSKNSEDQDSVVLSIIKHL